MTPAFIGRDGRSLSTRVALLAALAGASAGEDTSLVRVATLGEPTAFDVSTIHAKLRVVEATVMPGELSVTVDDLLTKELLNGRCVVLDLPGSALVDPALAGRPDIVRVVPVGPHEIDLHIAGAKLLDASVRTGKSASPAPPRLLSCGLAPGTPEDEEGRLGNAGRPENRVGGPWMQLGLPDLPPREWDGVLRGEPHPGVLALGQALLRELRGQPDIEPSPGSSVAVETFAARLWGLAMDVASYERGFSPAPVELARAPLIDDWAHVLRANIALEGRFEGHPHIRDGARSLTSDIFHTDGKTYARTLSRLYRLGRPATERHLQ